MLDTTPYHYYCYTPRTAFMLKVQSSASLSMAVSASDVFTLVISPFKVTNYVVNHARRHSRRCNLEHAPTAALLLYLQALCTQDHRRSASTVTRCLRTIRLRKMEVIQAFRRALLVTLCVRELPRKNYLAETHLLGMFKT